MNRNVQQGRHHPHQIIDQHHHHLQHPHHIQRSTGRHGQHYIENEENLSERDLMGRMNIPQIEITKDTPSESINPMESYSEEEFEQTMRMRGSRGYGGTSPIPPHRTRDSYERSHFGPADQYSGRLTLQQQQQIRQQQQFMKDKNVRWFVALFDYDPQTMSPNPDAAVEELPFHEGQLIKVVEGRLETDFEDLSWLLL